jgi:hypothetical protein
MAFGAKLPAGSPARSFQGPFYSHSQRSHRAIAANPPACASFLSTAPVAVGYGRRGFLRPGGPGRRDASAVAKSFRGHGGFGPRDYKTLGVKTQLVVYPNGGREFSQPARLRDVVERSAAWLNQVLQPRNEGAGCWVGSNFAPEVERLCFMAGGPPS